MFTKISADSIEPALWTLRAYNASLEEEGFPSRLNEDFIESKLCELEELEPDSPETYQIYWLTYASLAHQLAHPAADEQEGHVNCQRSPLE